ncbi:MAG TPA: hypothetical protein VKM94_24575 [Blastocatellia bacterium]|nr:hypothetical protein [Blastocatellia bacterium]
MTGLQGSTQPASQRADGSIMPRVTTGNTMAPCIIIGQRAAEVLRTEHKLGTSARFAAASYATLDSASLTTSVYVRRTPIRKNVER